MTMAMGLTPVGDFNAAKIDADQEHSQPGNVGWEEPLQQLGGKEGNENGGESTDHDSAQVRTICIIPCAASLQKD